MHGGDTSERTSTEPVVAAAPASRPRWWTQIALIAAVWWLYDAVNNLAPLRAARAMANGLAILHVETSLGLDAERWMNRWLDDHLLIGRWLGSYYDLAHFAVTTAVLVWVWWRHPGPYRLLRNGLLAMNGIGFVVYWAYPVAPPRMLAGFTDIVAVADALGGGSSGVLASQANQYAAMPSLHVAWALWCAIAVWTVRTDRPARALATAYVALTTVAVMATANHYLLDVAAGAATAGVAMGLALGFRLVRRRTTSPGHESERASAGGTAATARPMGPVRGS